MDRRNGSRGNKNRTTGKDQRQQKAQTRGILPEVLVAYEAACMDAWTAHEAPPPLLFDDIRGRIPYQKNIEFARKNVHIGQAKLLFTEIRFMTRLLQQMKNPEFLKKLPTDSHGRIVILYVGAAPSNKHPILARLFPWAKFILIDPAKFVLLGAEPGSVVTLEISTSDRMIELAISAEAQNVIIRDFFTTKFARSVAKFLPHCPIISDIRTNDDEKSQLPDSADIIKNLCETMNWSEIIQPALAITKWRHPFYDDPAEKVEETFAKEAEEFDLARVDFRKNYREGKLLEWFDGEVWLQQFAPRSSTESRLVYGWFSPAGDINPPEIKMWGSSADYENAFFLYNGVDRCQKHHSNFAADRFAGIDHCGDCAGAAHILGDYYDETHVDPSIEDKKKFVTEIFDELCRRLSRSLFECDHGKLF